MLLRPTALLAAVLLHLSAVALLARADAVQRGLAGHGDRTDAMKVALVAAIASTSPTTGADLSAPQRTVVPAAIPETMPVPPVYLPVGKLTRAARPLEAIDLNGEALDASDFAGELELVLLIERDGSVGEVVFPAAAGGARAFAERAAARFMAARFHPGEIDGRPVRSELRVKVVSEPLGQAGVAAPALH